MLPTLRKSSILALVLGGSVAAAAPAPFSRLVAPMEPAPDPSLTETWCDARAVVGETLRRDFAEEPRLAALTGTGLRMEFWASDLLGSWTLVHHGQDGISCIVTSGMDWTKGADAAVLLDRALAEAVHQS